ncbi:MAG TPA: hypothetical protein VGF75_03630 [Candidatus Saccharimonadales bacterium]|jgi:hypothetical protein
MSIQTSQKIDNEVELVNADELDPRQLRFMALYLDPESLSFGNCYQSAIQAGFSDQTSRNLTHNKPKWYSETLGQVRGLQPEHLVLKLTQIINDPKEPTQYKLKAIDMLMRSNRMYAPTYQNNVFFKLQDVLE